MKKPKEFIKSVEDLLELIEEGDLVRNTDKDYDFIKFMNRASRITKVLSQVKNNLNKIKTEK